MTRATNVRWLTWPALAVGSAAMVAVVAAATRPPCNEPAPPVAIPDAPPPAPIPVPSPDVPTEPADDDAAVYSGPGLVQGESDGVPPADVVEFGSETLRVRLRGDTDGLPVAMRVRLWRLGVPESSEWTAGDQVQTELLVPAEGVSVGRLPRGRFRLQCLDLRDGGVDPPEFGVAGGTNEAAVAVANRRTVRLRLLLTDAAGKPVRSAERIPRFGSVADESSSDAPKPRWARPRAPRRAVPPRASWVTGSPIACGFGGPPGVRIDAAPDGYFDLGTHVERGRTGYRKWGHDYVADAGGVVTLQADDSIGVDTTFVGVAPGFDALVARVVCPDGSPLAPSSAKVEATCYAIPCPWTAPDDAWRTVRVHVGVVRDGCEPLAFVWTAATADAEHRLVAKPPESPK